MWYLYYVAWVFIISIYCFPMKTDALKESILNDILFYSILFRSSFGTSSLEPPNASLWGFDALSHIDNLFCATNFGAPC